MCACSFQTTPHNFTVGELGRGPQNLHGICAIPGETSVAISTTTTNKPLILHRTTGTKGESVQWRADAEVLNSELTFINY